MTFRKLVWLMVVSGVVVVLVAARRVYYVESIVASETSYSSLFNRTFNLSKYDFDSMSLWQKANSQKVIVDDEYLYPIYPVSSTQIDDVVKLCESHNLRFISLVDACNRSYLKEDRVGNKSLGYPSSYIKKTKFAHKYSVKGNEYLPDGLDDGLKDNTSKRVWELLLLDDTDPIISTKNKKVAVIYFLVSQWLWGADAYVLDVLKRVSTVSYPALDKSFKLDSFTMLEYGNTIDPFGDYVNERRGFAVNGVVIPATQYCGTLMIKEEMFNKSILGVLAANAVNKKANMDALSEWIKWAVGYSYLKESKYNNDDDVLINLRKVYSRLVRYRKQLPLVGGWFVNYLVFGDYLSAFYKNYFVVQDASEVGFCIGS
jgi:hypothetical protein